MKQEMLKILERFESYDHLPGSHRRSNITTTFHFFWSIKAKTSWMLIFSFQIILYNECICCFCGLSCGHLFHFIAHHVNRVWLSSYNISILTLKTFSIVKLYFHLFSFSPQPDLFENIFIESPVCSWMYTIPFFVFIPSFWPLILCSYGS